MVSQSRFPNGNHSVFSREDFAAEACTDHVYRAVISGNFVTDKHGKRRVKTKVDRYCTRCGAKEPEFDLLARIRSSRFKRLVGRLPRRGFGKQG